MERENFAPSEACTQGSMLAWLDDGEEQRIKAAFQFASLDKSRHDGPHIYSSTAKQHFIFRLFESFYFTPVYEMNAE